MSLWAYYLSSKRSLSIWSASLMLCGDSAKRSSSWRVRGRRWDARCRIYSYSHIFLPTVSYTLVDYCPDDFWEVQDSLWYLPRRLSRVRLFLFVI